MDDYSINSLTDSKNEWCAQLVSILTYNINTGINSIFNESLKICEENNEENKYLMTFQNLLSKIPEWTSNTIETERKRIEKESSCKYLEDLITCVHIIQLKALSCIRVGLKQKKIDIDIPDIDKFIHKTYINCARKLYSNIYLFEKDIYPLQKQKNNRELELLIKEAILNTIRENIPVEELLRVYMEETEEYEEVSENIKKNNNNKNNLIKNTKLNAENNNNNNNNNANNSENSNTENNANSSENNANVLKNSNINLENENLELSEREKNNIENKNNEFDIKKTDNELNLNFSNIDNTFDESGKTEEVIAPKDLESINNKNINKDFIYGKEIPNDNENEDDDNIKLNIGNDININMETINLNEELKLDDSPLLDDIEELP